MRHHLLFRYIKDRTGVITWSNLALLALVAALPYPATLLGATFSGLTLMVFLLPLSLVAGLTWWMWEYARRDGLAISTRDPVTSRYLRSTFAASFVALIAAAALAAAGWRMGVISLVWAAVVLLAVQFAVRYVLAMIWPPPRPIDQPPEPESPAELAEERTTRGILEQLRNGSDTDRLTVFTGGVVAIAVTILALQLKGPESAGDITDQMVLSNLGEQPIATYFVTFALVGLFWVLHVHLFERVKAADPILLWLNLVFLLFVAFLPIPYEIHNQALDADSLAIYLECMGATALSLALMSIHAQRDGRLLSEPGLPTSGWQFVRDQLVAKRRIAAQRCTGRGHRRPSMGQPVLGQPDDSCPVPKNHPALRRRCGQLSGRTPIPLSRPTDSAELVVGPTVAGQAIRRDTFRFVTDLNAKILAFITNWNTHRAHPFVWTKTADQILKNTRRPTTSNPDHQIGEPELDSFGQGPRFAWATHSSGLILSALLHVPLG